MMKKLRGERGAAAIVITMLLFGLIGSVAIAVDVGAHYQRGSQLRKAADAAVLAGIVDQVDFNDTMAANQQITALLRQNGIDVDSADIAVTVTRPTSDTVQVTITHSNWKPAFGGLFGVDSQVIRSSTAQLNVCDADCYQTVDIPEPPHVELRTTGTGDGYIPIFVPGDDRLFAINHKSVVGQKGLTCIDRTINAQCAGYPRGLHTTFGNGGSSGGNIAVNNRVTTVQKDGRIYFGGQATLNSVSWFGIGCFDITTNASCGFRQLARLPGFSNQYSTRGGGPVQHGNKLIAFTNDGYMHCIDMSLWGAAPPASQCSASYPARSGLRLAGLPAYDPNAEAQGGSTRQMHPVAMKITGSRVYSNFHYRSQKDSAGVFFGSYIHCFDVVATAPCSGGFPNALKLPWRIDSASGGDGSLFFMMGSTTVTPTGVCSIKMGSATRCWNSTTGASVELPNVLKNKLTSPPEVYEPFQHGNRLFLPGGWSQSKVLCYDWSTGALCGPKADWVDWKVDTFAKDSTLLASVGQTADYGYAHNGKCFIGMGHTNFWWTFDEDLNACRDTSVEISLVKCVCTNGDRFWGDVRIANVDLADGVSFTRFDIKITNPATGAVLYTKDMIDSDGVIKLADVIPQYLERIVISVDVESTADFNAWLGGNAPTVEIRYRENPSLVGG